MVLLLGPAVGSVVGITMRPTPRFLCAGFAFAAGVMVAVSFLDLVPESLALISPLAVAASFLLGFLGMYAMDQLLPHFHPISDTDERATLRRTSLTLIVGVALHNLPEGFAVGASFSSTADLGLIVAIALSLHDIPETIVPVSASLAVMGKKGRAFLIGWGITAVTLVGFGVGLPLANIISGEAIAYALAATAGIMIYISSDELFPASHALKMPHTTNMSLMLGVLFVILLRLLI